VTPNVPPRAPPARRESHVSVGGAPLDPPKIYTMAVPDFMVEGGDDYGMLDGQRMLIGPESATLIALALEDYIKAHSPVAPRVEGRIAIAQ
jgi:5'-nucleotidase